MKGQPRNKKERQAELRGLHSRAEKIFRKLPGVVGVGFGFKETEGKITNDLSIRVYVRKKKSLAEIPIKDRVPCEFEGFATDVLKAPEIDLYNCEDYREYSTLIGGIAITRWRPLRLSASETITLTSQGTLGFFATNDDLDTSKNVVIVSNHHVLTTYSGVEGSPILQAPLIEDESTGDILLAVSEERPLATLITSTTVANIHNVGIEANRPYLYVAPLAFPGEIERSYYIDCSTALIDISVSSWCGTNCGRKYKNEIRGLNIGGGTDSTGNSKIAGVERMPMVDEEDNYLVYKSGYRTGRTVGRVIDSMVTGTLNLDDGTTREVRNVIQILPLKPDCHGLQRFSAKGDSGSAIINSSNKLVGLLFGGREETLEDWTAETAKSEAKDAVKAAKTAVENASTPAELATANANLVTAEQTLETAAAAVVPRPTYACHIHPVLHFLQVTPISEENPPVGPAGVARSNLSGSFMDEVDETLVLRDRFISTLRGAHIYNTILKHRDEVVERVNNQRPVTVAWHRNEGPLMLNHLVNNARNPDHKIPFEFDGLSRTFILENLAETFLEHGSDDLKDDIISNYDEVQSWIDSFDDLHKFVELFDSLPLPEKELADA